jgi:DNA-binding GntR family transcriptional regulator
MFGASLVVLAGEETAMPTRTTDRIAETIRRLVITGELQAGTLVSEAHLSKLLQCGRTPLREALQRLSHEHLVDLPPRRGILVPELSIIDFQEAAEALLYDGATHAELAAHRITDQQVQELRDIVSEQQQLNAAGTFYAVAELDCRFHTLLAEATGNRYFAENARRLHTSLERFIYRSWETTGTSERSVEEHSLIVDALEERDPVLSKERLQQHAELGRQRVLHILGLGDHTQES